MTNTADLAVVLAAVTMLTGLGWFFFGPRRAASAHLVGGVQRVEVTVRGGYSPDAMRVRQGIPAELVFDRQESGDCTSRVVFPDLQVSAALPAYQRTTVRLTPARTGTFGFACGMNMIHGTLLVEPADETAAAGGRAVAGGAASMLAPDRTETPRPPLRVIPEAGSAEHAHGAQAGPRAETAHQAAAHPEAAHPEAGHAEHAHGAEAPPATSTARRRGGRRSRT